MNRIQLLFLILFFFRLSDCMSEVKWERLKTNYITGFSINTIISNSKGVIFAGASSNSTYRTSNLGKDWKKLPLKGLARQFYIKDDSTIFAVTQQSGSDYYLSVSEDTGNTWKNIFRGTNSTDIKSFAFDQIGNLYIIYGTSVYKSTDKGSKWDYVSSIVSGMYCYSMIFTNDDKLIISTSKGIYLSANQGISFAKRNLDSVVTFKTMRILRDGTIFSCGYNGRIYISTDTGIVWSKIKKPYHDSSDRTGNIFIDSKDNLYLTTRFYDLYKTSDKGNSWANLSINDSVREFVTFEIGNNDYLLNSTLNHGLFLSSDYGEQWSQLTNIKENVRINNLCVRKGTELISSSTDHEIYRSTDGGDNWISLKKPVDKPVLDILTNTSGDIYSVHEDDGIYLSTNAGQKWNPSNYGINNNVLSLFAFCDSEMVAGTMYGGIYRSSDYGISWERSRTDSSEMSVTSFTIDNSDRIYASSFEKGILSSTDKGYRWQLVSGDLDSMIIELMLCDGEGLLYAVEDNGRMYKSADNGQTWNILSNAPSNIAFTGAVIDNRNIIYIATAGKGIQLSSDKGETWRICSSDINSDTIYAITLDSLGFIYSFASDNYCYRTVEPVNTVCNPETESKLLIYPNPAENFICFQIQSGNSSNLFSVYEIFDTKGILVRKSIITAQESNLKIDITCLIPGVYYIRINKLIYKFIKFL